MTADAGFKKLVRARMTETGERYTEARAALLAEHEALLRSEEAFRARTLRSFLRDGRLVSVPARRRARVVVLLELLDLFDPGREYPETEVNALLRAVHDDVAYLRREMVDYGFLSREHGVYRVSETPKEMTGNMAAEVPSDLRSRLSRPGAAVERAEHVVLRELTTADHDALTDLLADDAGYSRRVHGRPPADEDAVSVLSHQPAGTGAEQHHVLGLERGGWLDAVAVVLTDWPEPGTTHIALLQVRGALHGHGLGRALHEALLARFPRTRTWRLSVVEDNAVALGFWEALGYRRTSEVRAWRDDAGKPHGAWVLARDGGTSR